MSLIMLKNMITKVRMTTIELGFDWFSIILAFSID